MLNATRKTHTLIKESNKWVRTNKKPQCIKTIRNIPASDNNLFASRATYPSINKV